MAKCGCALCFLLNKVLILDLFLAWYVARSDLSQAHKNSTTPLNQIFFPEIYGNLSDYRLYSHYVNTSQGHGKLEIGYLLDSLKELNILKPDYEQCYTVEKVVRQVLPRRPLNHFSDDSRMIADDAYVKYVTVQLLIRVSDATVVEKRNLHVSSNSRDAVDREDTRRVRMKCEQNRTEVINCEPRRKRYKSQSHSTPGIEAVSVLNHTQRVVIATCSSVIGLFFLVAAFLRLRNCIRRQRNAQFLAKRVPDPAFRGGSFSLTNSATQNSHLLGTVFNKFGNRSNGYSLDSVSWSGSPADTSRPLNQPVFIITEPSEVNSSTSSITSHDDVNTEEMDKKSGFDEDQLKCIGEHGYDCDAIDKSVQSSDPINQSDAVTFTSETDQFICHDT